MKILYLAFYALAWIVAVYLFNATLAKRFQKVHLRLALLYITGMAALGVLGEILVGGGYHHIFHVNFWTWQVFPIYHGYTSFYAPFLWGIYGFQLYLLHDNLASRGITSDNKVALIFGVETIILEIILNLSFLAIFGQYLFYYSPSDLWHFTSIQTFPFFFVASLVYTKIIRREMKHIDDSALANLLLCCLLVALE